MLDLYEIKKNNIVPTNAPNLLYSLFTMSVRYSIYFVITFAHGQHFIVCKICKIEKQLNKSKKKKSTQNVASVCVSVCNKVGCVADYPSGFDTCYRYGRFLSHFNVSCCKVSFCDQNHLINSNDES